MPEVKPYKTTLDQGNAYWMARLSNVAYYKVSKEDQMPDEDKILEDLKKEDQKFISVKGFSQNSAQAVLIEHDNYLCMSFRGTNELKDWLDNLNAFSQKALFGEFHKGFWNSVVDVWDGLEKRYKDLREAKKRPLFLTGHSLGGAMATVAAARLIYEDIPFTSVYTFGQPRATARGHTSSYFNSETKARYFRFQNNNDIVTRVPTRVMGYSHIGSYIYIEEETLKLHQDPGFWFKFIDMVEGAYNDLLKKGVDGVKDHAMKNYLEAVKKWDCDF